MTSRWNVWRGALSSTPIGPMWRLRIWRHISAAALLTTNRNPPRICSWRSSCAFKILPTCSSRTSGRSSMKSSPTRWVCSECKVLFAKPERNHGGVTGSLNSQPGVSSSRFPAPLPAPLPVGNEADIVVQALDHPGTTQEVIMFILNHQIKKIHRDNIRPDPRQTPGLVTPAPKQPSTFTCECNKNTTCYLHSNFHTENAA